MPGKPGGDDGDAQTSRPIREQSVPISSGPDLARHPWVSAVYGKGLRAAWKVVGPGARPVENQCSKEFSNTPVEGAGRLYWTARFSSCTQFTMSTTSRLSGYSEGEDVHNGPVIRNER
ncbi:hypothetical protein EYF80_011422 [Liparis tanakae]|uniref:Uncharacterized protein n=1 Tax=Liparis tanakae TaxID=230148 RepID=A0A4Z2IL43_9TELE|nr:hypothetical protein EYF80_011422 [Liparis tanakae]